LRARDGAARRRPARPAASPPPVSGGGAAAARIWGPQTLTLNEGVQARRRDLKGTSVLAGKTGFAAYVEVLLTGRSVHADYVLGVTAAKR